MARRVAVVGGGAVGTTVAHDLARAGADVVLYERERIGGGSTARSAGICYDAFSEPRDTRLARRALERFRDFSGSGDFRFHSMPYVWFATEPGAGVDAIREGAQQMAERGLDVELPDPSRLEAAHPALDLSDAEVAAVASNAGTADPVAYAEALADRAGAAGAELRTGEAATVSTDPPRVNGDRFDAVVVAAGARTKHLLADAGLPAPLAPYRVQAFLAGGPAIPILYDATAEYYARPHPGGVLAGDGAMLEEADPVQYDRDADDWFVDRVAGVLEDRLVNYQVDDVDAWAGLCVATPDQRPLLGELADGIYVAAGWHGHGFMRAPAVGERLADQVLGGDGVEAFRPDRFDGDEEFDIVDSIGV